MEILNFWALQGVWLQGWETSQAPRLCHPTKVPVQWISFNGFSLISLPSCSSFQVLDIFQISNEILFEKQTLSAPSKGREICISMKPHFLLKTHFGKTKSPNRTTQSTQFPCVSIHFSFPSQSPSHSLPA